MMMLLDGHSLTQKDVLRPENVSAELKLEGGSSLSFNVGPNEPDIPIDSWVRWSTPQGKAVIWRVKSAEDNYNTGTRSIQAEDLTATLRDGLIFGEVTTEMLAGVTGAKTVSARKAFEYILGRQQMWSLGDFEYDVSLPYNFNNAKLYDALETICSGLQDWWWDVDYTAFTISVRHKSESVSCEMRETRNLVSLKKRIDRSNMYTRFYPVGNRNMHIAGEYVSQNEQIYGIICHQETDQSKDTEEMLRAWAVDKLARHCEPIVTVTVSGLELSASTGEELDRLTLGTLCRIPLPEIGAVITERIISLKWSDAENRPEEVSVTMANNLQDVQTIVSNISKSAGGGAGASAKNAEEDHAWFVDTTTKVGMVAESIVGRDADGNPNWSKVATLMVEGNQIEGRVVEAEGEIVTHETRITQNEQAITLEATNRENADNTLSGRITVEAGRITQEVSDRAGADTVLDGKITVEKNRITQEVTDRTNADNTLDGKITVEAGRITQEVTDRTNGDATLDGKITVEAGRITQEVTDRTNADSTLDGKITVEAGRITQEVTDRTNGDATLDGKITVEAGRITQEVTDRTNADTTLDGKITVNANKISLVVSEESGQNVVNAASIVAGINGQDPSAPSYVNIQANRINLYGYVTASQLSAVQATIDNLTTGMTTAGALKAQAVYANQGITVQSHALGFDKFENINGVTKYCLCYS